LSLDPIESIAVLPNATDNFDEVWMVVNRANGRFVERMVRRLKESDCGTTKVILDEQVFMDSTVSFDEGKVISAITAQNGAVYTITSDAHGYSNGDTVVLRNVAGEVGLSNRKWIIGSVTTNTFMLVREVT
jgi:hypothetical protein